MTRLPSVSYREVLRALRRDGWVIVRQRGSHIRVQKHVGDELLKVTVPAHSPIKRGTLRTILRYARMESDRFLELL
ncbi:MAG TPA: addiction module toxin, HicA family [Candidatus Hydrogenedentes bacterium]|nr:addiction module toxin, HicA family [Candidatus Hydrogenedentota bacterium]HIJ74438.1 addiction module toxin, HicA family [Candidatus Hydrogenedentota bacterium]